MVKHTQPKVIILKQLFLNALWYPNIENFPEREFITQNLIHFL